ncbi:MAG TPA: phytoene/squalene synthase family protein [Candidatus Sulfotelmatobacter sp.]|nr:phytoene/squalene synthase family protein [Candidatus Sulfotelmatobacter sp.]
MSAGTQPAPMAWTPAPPQLAIAYSVCRGITRAAAKNFYYAFLVLPRRKRQALCAVYAFMRRCDDISDDPSLSLEERRRKLDLWLDALHNAQQGQPTDDPILLGLTDSQRRFHIPAGLLDELAHGTAMDLETDTRDPDATASNVAGLTVQYRTFDDLRQYCYRVASVVGLVCIHVFGYRDPAAEPLAENCGLAFQLTNIIRDVKEDVALGRIYLPQEDLNKVGLSATDLLGTPDPARLRPLLALQAERAREFYRSGDELLPYISEDSQPALWVLVNIYRKLLEKIAGRQFDVFQEKISLTTWEKLRILGQGFVQRIL